MDNSNQISQENQPSNYKKPDPRKSLVKEYRKIKKYLEQMDQSLQLMFAWYKEYDSLERCETLLEIGKVRSGLEELMKAFYLEM